MKIGIIVAMGKELELLLPLLNDTKEITINDITFYNGRCAANEVIVMKSGIGKVNAAVGTLTLIETFHPVLVLNTGVAGGLGADAGVLDVVVADRVAYHDVWCGPGTVWGQVQGLPRFFETATLALDDPSLKHGLIASGDIFVSRPEEVAHIRGLYPDAMACDMESGAIAQVCALKGVPMAVIRVVSDTPGQGDNLSQYQSFWDDAPARTTDLLRRLLPRL